TRTSALTTPETAMTIQATSATFENRVAASVRCAPRLRPCASSAMSPPTHSAAPMRWYSRLLVATSWEPPLAEWPVTATGTRPATATKNRVAVHPHDSTSLHPSASSNATKAVISQAFGCSMAPTKLRNLSGSSSSVTGLPAPSAATKNTEVNANTNQAQAAYPAVRTAA